MRKIAIYAVSSLGTTVLGLLFALTGAIGANVANAQAVNCPEGYICTPIAPTEFQCPTGYVCTPIVASVANPGATFSLSGTPAITTNIISNSYGGTTTENVEATFDVQVTAVGEPVVLGLPNSANPAFTGSDFNQLGIYTNGVLSILSSYSPVMAAYSQPANTSLSSDGKSFTIGSNQTVTIPVTYSFNVFNPGANTCAVQVRGIAWSAAGFADVNVDNSMENDPSWRTAAINCGSPDAVQANVGTIISTSTATSTTTGTATSSVQVYYPLSVTLDQTATDRAGVWFDFGPGVGNINKSPADWNWTATLTLPWPKTLESITMQHDLHGEAWSTSYSRYLPNGDDIYGYNEHPYPLVVDYNGSQIDTSYDQALPTLPAGQSTLKLYGQREYSSFLGGTITVAFTDGTYVTAEVPAGSAQSSTQQPTSVTTYQSNPNAVYDISVTSPPNTGATWALNGNYPINWTYPNALAGKTVKLGILLVNSQMSSWLIDSETVTLPSDVSRLGASTPWSYLYQNNSNNLPPALSAGSYFVQVNALDPSTGIMHSGNSGGLNVGNSSTLPQTSIEVSGPASGSTFAPGQGIVVSFGNPVYGANYKVLLNEDAVMGQSYAIGKVSGQSVATQSGSFNIPSNATPGQYGVEVVQTTSPSGQCPTTGCAIGYSEESFTVANSPTQQPMINYLPTQTPVYSPSPSPTATPTASQTTQTVTTTTTAPAPTATFTVDGAHNMTYSVGQTNHYYWSSTGADTFSSTYISNNPSQCGQGSWLANTASGSFSSYLGSNYAGCSWTVTYTAKNSKTGWSASDTITENVLSPAPAATVSPVSSPSSSPSASPSPYTSPSPSSSPQAVQSDNGDQTAAGANSGGFWSNLFKALGF